MKNNNFTPIIIPANRYCNNEALVGFIDSQSIYATDTPYFPYLPNHDRIITNLGNFSRNFKNLIYKQLIFSIPYDRINYNPKDYKLVTKLESFKTTLVTVWLIKKDCIKDANSYYTILPNSKLQLLSEFANKNNLKPNSLISNGGFFITPNLIYNKDKSKNWAFEKRFSQIKITGNLSPYYGFYYVRTQDGIFSTFQDFTNRGCVVISENNNISLISHLDINQYSVSFDNQNYFMIREKDINNLSFNFPIILITSACKTPQNLELTNIIKTSVWEDQSWQSYHEVIVNNRVNIFITNRGNGIHPEDFIAEIWEDKMPLINFGNILSFDKEFFANKWGNIDILKLSI